MVIAAAAQKKHASTLRREHEARTGCKANMEQLGWKCLSYTTKGVPNKFERAVIQRHTFRIVSTHGGLWRLERSNGEFYPGINVPVMVRLDTPHFSGPVTLATWFEVEIASGNSFRITAR